MYIRSDLIATNGTISPFSFSGCVFIVSSSSWSLLKIIFQIVFRARFSFNNSFSHTYTAGHRRASNLEFFFFLFIHLSVHSFIALGGLLTVRRRLGCRRSFIHGAAAAAAAPPRRRRRRVFYAVPLRLLFPSLPPPPSPPLPSRFVH